ncbi:Y-family DNA polymerase [Wenxinia saemankumensis]|uniref:Protein ImuB n=1 Tax=Wenxinia saemankumensis TaxID=1447782 RepID=A0A1M6AYS0_9RHOB|nr:DNA polymerase Y family protein [Wenxinia saemankumensis]SHI41577.1 protein ImuB [Wenxinia saemankumensis]
MTDEDKLPVLSAPARHRPRSTIAAPPRPERRSAAGVVPLTLPAAPPRRDADADLLAQAFAALRAAERAERDDPGPPGAGSGSGSGPGRADEDAFSPVGTPPRTPGPATAMRRPAGRAPAFAPGGSSAGGQAAEPAEPRAAARRILSIHLPRFSMTRYLRHRARTGEAVAPDLPMALAVEGAHGPVIHATTRAAEAAGAAAGGRVVDARALIPDLQIAFADTAGDAAALARLVLWMRRFCPWSASDGLTARGGAGLVLDTTGSDHLWGGEPAMLAEIEGALGTLGLEAELAIAPTRGAAWALARFGDLRGIARPGDLPARLAPLPVRALRIDGDTVQVLQRLGLKTIGDLAAVPRLSLARRFSRAEAPRNPLLRLDQATGRLAEPLDAPDEPPRFAVQARLAEPVQDPTAHLPALAEELAAALAAEGFGLRRAVLTVYRTDGEVSALGVATSAATRDPAHIVRLFDGRLERIDPGFGFDLLTLHAEVAERLDARAPRLDGAAGSGEALARLVDRLAGRFGPGNVLRPAPRERHVPERAEGWASAMGRAPRPAPPRARRPAPQTPAAPRPPTPPGGRPALALVAARPSRPARLPRPWRLIEPPEEVRVLYAVPEGPPAQFVWRRVPHRILRFDGPERIAPEWWADRPTTRLRDYYRIEDQSGRRYWIYRHGLEGDGRGRTPDWFLHGVFA